MNRIVQPKSDELLSSYLLRLADAHFADHYRFYSHVAPGVSVWNRDIDRHVPPGLVQCLGDRFSLPEATIRSLTLPPYEALISGSRAAKGPACGMWVNPVGVYHRTRRLRGLQACLECLRERHVFYRTWRLSFVTKCDRHRCWLVDACPSCDAPIVPHRQLPGSTRCHQCNTSLCRNAGVSNREHALPFAQRAFLEALHSGQPIESVGGPISLEDIARGIRLLRNLGMFAAIGAGVGGPVERRRVLERQMYFEAICELATGWPTTIDRLHLKGRVSRPRFNELDVPAWLLGLHDRLEGGVRRFRKRRPRPSPSQAVRELQLRKPDGWRTHRAALIVQVALRRQ